MIAALAFIALAPQGAPVQPVEDRVEATLKQMTLDEKIAIIGGTKEMYIRSIPRLGLNEVKMSDGPMGVRTWGQSTAYPAGANLAATFDPELAQTFGAAIGRDARARGVQIWLAPGVNLARIPFCGRNFEYYGEDPFLSSKIAVGTIKGVQSQGVVATIKHFAANNHESDRHRDDSQVDERTMRELYLRPFEAGVKEGGTWSVMCAYNKFDGTYCSANEWLQNQVLKREWGFKGVVMSDWGATHDTLGPALHGLDLEMPGPDYFNAGALKPMIEDGRVPLLVLDDKVRRILRMGYSMGFYDRDPKDASLPLDSAKNGQVALKMAREGIVLLKNQGAMLPLDRKKVKRILVVGPNAESTSVTGGGSGYTEAFRSVTALQGIRQAAGLNVKVVSMPLFSESSSYKLEGVQAPGLKGEYFVNRTLSGEPKMVRTDANVDFNWGSGSPDPAIPSNGFSVRWTGKYTPASAGDHVIATRSDDGIRVWLDGKLVVDHWMERGATADLADMKLVGGHTYNLKVEYFQGDGLAEAHFGIQSEAAVLKNSVPDSELAKADAVIACVGFNAATESEGSDRPFELSWGQSRALRNLVARSKKVVVVNTSGAGVDMSGFVDKAAAIIQQWYPGENGNQALGEVLFGDVNPSGKLPTTFPKAIKGTYYEKAYPPVYNVVKYTEGLFIGYRWFDANNAQPLFPFGFGLSYTTFKLGGLKVTKVGDAVRVTASVTNTGKRLGAETAQVYVGRTDPSAVVRVKKELKGFQRVELRPGETKQIAVTLPSNAFAYWNVKSQKWVVEPGAYTIWLGSSSRSLAAKAVVKQ